MATMNGDHRASAPKCRRYHALSFLPFVLFRYSVIILRIASASLPRFSSSMSCRTAFHTLSRRDTLFRISGSLSLSFFILAL
jgi:hypothetical protein